jgi:hypothetical protein
MSKKWTRDMDVAVVVGLSGLLAAGAAAIEGSKKDGRKSRSPRIDQRSKSVMARAKR